MMADPLQWRGVGDRRSERLVHISAEPLTSTYRHGSLLELFHAMHPGRTRYANRGLLKGVGRGWRAVGFE